MSQKVIIVGAGPVGLLLANLLGSKNIETLILEKDLTRNAWSKAIGITPPSMEILNKLSLSQIFIKNGIIGKRATFFGNKVRLGSMKIKEIKSKFPFVLSLPQYITEQILENNLKKFPCVTFLRGYKVVDIKKLENSYSISCHHIAQSKDVSFQAEIICACDGDKSFIRSKLNITFLGYYFKPTFIMGDYFDTFPFNQDAVLWFTKKGSVESFPLPEKKRRWIIQTYKFIENPKVGFFEKIIFKRTSFDLNRRDKISENPFGIQRFLANSYWKDKVFLCGDAAHTMPPIGGQGMNTGFADAEFLAVIIYTYLRYHEVNLEFLAGKYEYYRKIAAKSATLRADFGMRIGTARNSLFSLIRSAILIILLHLPISRLVIPFFTMTNIPYNRLFKVLDKENIFKLATKKNEKKG
jgi:2-polyprenyl-6-methoxyphenol hydroxylase-like FAD-dependent oxidoreductase